MTTGRPLSMSQGPSWALNDSPFDDDHATATQAFDSGLDFEETDQFNPNGLAHGGHTRTYSFAGPKSPIRTPVKPSFKGHLRQGSGYALSPVSAAFPEHILDHTHDPTPARGHTHSQSTHSDHSAYSLSNGHIHNHAHTHEHGHSHDHSHDHAHTHNHTHSHDHAPQHAPIHATSSNSPSSSLVEILTGILIPIPYLLASAAYSTPNTNFPPLSAYARLQQAVPDGKKIEDYTNAHHASSLLQACTLTSGTLLLIAILANIRASERGLDKRKSSNAGLTPPGPLTLQSILAMVTSTFRVGLPYYAAIQIGGLRVGLVLLVALASGISCFDRHSKSFFASFSSRPLTLAALVLCVLADAFGMTVYADVYHLATGYAALLTSVFLLHPPLPANGSSTSPLIATPSDTTTTLILCERDSRRIAYFTCLNFGFMLVQAFYGWVSGSLGLLSDTVHMFFDCLALVIGLGAAVASKWPTSPEMPFGWGKLNVLAGFGNGIFLMLVSVEFIWEAVEGIMEGTELRHVEELLVVSTLGFLVNMVGLFAFGHAHHGHDHDHSHAHDNENMHGIYLHVAADAGGSLAVILSTILTLWKPWYLWDPLATIVIAVLIFLAAVPLVRDSGGKLLLVIPDDLEYGLKTALQELSGLRGVVGYKVPRFWVEDDGVMIMATITITITITIMIMPTTMHITITTLTNPQRKKILGVIHVFCASAADPEDVRERVNDYFLQLNMHVVVQVEREGEGRCWCGGGVKSG
ncbi:unnamed protein product [Aureobasidium mustum]|uniref:Zinc transporter n=1 Tax=Aureobasidium mustum TaxID=2773714 RepID=A0A9N8JWS8_9PEZI|nr:unnamed protein product [Aureobasidium mustum]